jgi:eukaryotic-like serine/threonine-protein kinase
MATGKRAFEGRTSADTMSAILKDDVPELSDSNRTVPPALDRIVRHCLEKNSEERFHSTRDIAFALEGLSGVTTGSGAVAAMPAVSRRWLLYSAIAAVALIAFAVGLLARGMFGPAPLPRVSPDHLPARKHRYCALRARW